MTGFPGSHAGQQSLVQQQLMRNQVPPQMAANPYVNKPDMKSAAAQAVASTNQQQQLGGLQNRQYTAAAAAAVASNSNAVQQQQQQQQAVKSAATSLASMSLRSTVLGTGPPPTNGTAAAVSATAGTPSVQQTTSYSPTPIQRPPGGKGT